MRDTILTGIAASSTQRKSARKMHTRPCSLPRPRLDDWECTIPGLLPEGSRLIEDARDVCGTNRWHESRPRCQRSGAFQELRVIERVFRLVLPKECVPKLAFDAVHKLALSAVRPLAYHAGQFLAFEGPCGTAAVIEGQASLAGRGASS